MRLRTCLIVLASLLLIQYAFAQSIDSVKQNAIENDVEPKAETLNWYESKAMPWIVSLTIALATIVVNLWISYSQRKTSLKVVTAQIESSIRLARTQFEFTLNSKNRQDWINELRNCISEFATHVRQINIVFQRPDFTDKAFALHEKIFLYRSKIKLLLNYTKEEHKAFHSSQEDLMSILEIHLLNSNAKIDQFNNVDFGQKLNIMIEKRRDLLYHEWQKVQNAQ